MIIGKPLSPDAKVFVSEKTFGPSFNGYFPVGSLKPLLSSLRGILSPPIDPKITGSCAFSPSLKNPKTHVPSTSPRGVVPIPFIAADVIG